MQQPHTKHTKPEQRRPSSAMSRLVGAGVVIAGVLIAALVIRTTLPAAARRADAHPSASGHGDGGDGGQRRTDGGTQHRGGAGTHTDRRADGIAGSVIDAGAGDRDIRATEPDTGTRGHAGA
jgi:hypothetical protein